MIKLKPWQWIILAAPIALIVGFIVFAAIVTINQWKLNWIWAVFILIFLGWRWLLVKWTRSNVEEIETIVNQVNQQLESAQITNDKVLKGDNNLIKAQNLLREVLQASANDPPIWIDSSQFWLRCQELIVGISGIYHPEVKYPLLNIYIPQAYNLLRGTVDDLDRWMEQLSPALNQLTVGQAYQAYELYQKISPSVSKFVEAWNLSQWILNPLVAITKIASNNYSERANQELIVNLSRTLRQALLYNLCQKAMLLYGSETIPITSPSEATAKTPKAKTETLREIIEKSTPVEEIEQQELNILLVGRTGAGKSSLINTLFQADLAEVDVLPSTDEIKSYQWKTPDGESLVLWDSPGYEQVKGKNYTEEVIEYGQTADLMLVVNPALDPSLQMDRDFIDQIRKLTDLPIIIVVTQVDRLRPMREWNPPYDWQNGNQPKEISIREAIAYRQESLGDYGLQILPVVTGDATSNRISWGVHELSLAIMGAVSPAKELRLARFLRDRDSRIIACAKVIDKYTFQMSTTQGLTSLLKSPILSFISTLSTGSPELGILLAQQIPIEQLPIVIGKLQMAYDLFQLLNFSTNKSLKFELISLWPLLSENSASPQVSAWALGNSLVEYWSKNLSKEQLEQKYQEYKAKV